MAMRAINLRSWPSAAVETKYSALNEPPQDKTNKMAVRPAKTQISLGIRLRCPYEESLGP